MTRILESGPAPHFHRPPRSGSPGARWLSPPGAFPALLAGLLVLSAALDTALGFEPAEVRAILWNRPSQADYPGQPGVVLAHQTHRIYNGNASGSLEEHFIATVFDPEASGLDRWEIDVDRRLQFVEVLAARRYRGEDVLDLDSSHWEELPQPGVPKDAYPFRHRFTIHFPDLMPGDVVEARVLIHIETDPKRYPTLWGIVPLAADLPVVERQFLLTAPQAIELSTSLEGWKAPMRRIYRDMVTYDLHTGHIPALGPGQGTCPGEPGVPSFAYTGVAGWSEAGRILGREFRWGAETASVAIRDSARTAIRGVSSSAERLAALLEIMDRQIQLAPQPSSLLRYWPRPAAWSFREKCADPTDWSCLLSALCTRAGLPSEVVLISNRAGRPLGKGANPFLFPHVALKVHLADEGRDAIIDPLRAPAGLRVRPFPGEIRTYVPTSEDSVDSLGPLPAGETSFIVDLYVEPESSGDGGLWGGRAVASGSGLGAAWLVQHLTEGVHAQENFAQMTGWRPDFDDPEGASLEKSWKESTAQATFRWVEVADSTRAPEAGSRLRRFLPLWRVADDSTGYCPEGPLSLTTRLHFPGAWMQKSQLRTWEGDFECGAWSLQLGFSGAGEASLEETVVWNGVEGCSGVIAGLGQARREALSP